MIFEFTSKWAKLFKLLRFYTTLHNIYLRGKEQYLSNGSR
jgi:hypothetical protein